MNDCLEWNSSVLLSFLSRHLCQQRSPLDVVGGDEDISVLVGWRTDGDWTGRTGGRGRMGRQKGGRQEMGILTSPFPSYWGIPNGQREEALTTICILHWSNVRCLRSNLQLGMCFVQGMPVKNVMTCHKTQLIPVVSWDPVSASEHLSPLNLSPDYLRPVPKCTIRTINNQKMSLCQTYSLNKLQSKL